MCRRATGSDVASLKSLCSTGHVEVGSGEKGEKNEGSNKLELYFFFCSTNQFG